MSMFLTTQARSQPDVCTEHKQCYLPRNISAKISYIAGVTTHANPHGAVTTWVVSANTRHVTCFSFFVYLFYYFILRLSLSPHRWADFDDQ